MVVSVCAAMVVGVFVIMVVGVSVAVVDGVSQYVVISTAVYGGLPATDTTRYGLLLSMWGLVYFCYLQI